MRYAWIVVTSLVVVAAAGLPFLLGAQEPSEAAPAPRERVVAGGHYYVLLTVVEVAPTDTDEKAWDNMGGEAPDLCYEIRWQGQRIFKSSVKDDTLVAKWSNVAVELSDVVDTVSLDDSIKAARVTARPAGELVFRVYDQDVASDDLVGEWTVPVMQLALGDTEWARPGGRIVSATCRVLPLDQVAFDTLTR